MTNGWVDMKNTDMMLIMGGNPAENHPCGFKWPVEAKRTRNAKIISVDPRFTRTSAVADLFCQIRAGTDIAFLGGVVHYAMENNRIAKDYLVNYTNAAFIVKSDFKLPADTDGVFSGFDAKTQSYDKSTWNYAGTGGDRGSDAAHPPSGSAPPAPRLPEKVEFDLSLQNPNCVFQLLKKHYSRYTPEMVERITGIPKEQFLKAADLYTSIRKDGDMKKAGTIIYAVGWTQHSFGTQIIRTAAILQLLLGNVGRAGGGVNALRGHSNIQGATDMAGIFDNLPGYLKVPTPADTSFDSWMKRITPTPSKPAPWDSFNYWSNTPKFAVSYLKALYGDAATKQNEWAFDYLPKVDRNYSWVQLWDNMYNGIVKGMFAFGMNGVAIGPDSKKNIDALKKADWLVVGEIYPDETSEFWKSPGISTDEMKQIQTTVYRLPCAGFAEKDGSFTNSARWLLWKNTALPMPGDCRMDQGIVAQIFLKIRELYKKDGGKFPDPVLNLTWNYSVPSNPPLAEVLKEINGKALADLEDPATKQQIKAGQQVRSSNEAANQSRPAGSRLRMAERRRHDLLRQLDLLRLVHRGGKSDRTARSFGPLKFGHTSGLGLVLAGESARAVQPRVVRRGRQALGSNEKTSLVERKHAKMGRQRRSGLQDRFQAERSHGPVHHESGGRRANLWAASGLRRWAAPRTLRTDRKSD